MDRLNLNHLKYFYAVAQYDTVTMAAEKLFVTPQTVSAQLGLLEDAIGYSLFDRVGKRLHLNKEGQIALRYTEDIFRSYRELISELNNLESTQEIILSIGILDSIPKTLSSQIFEAVYAEFSNVRIVTHETDFEQLLADLAINKLDMILSDRPLPPNVSVKAYSRRLISSDFTFFATAKLAAKLRARFPLSLDGQTFLMPGERSAQFTHVFSWLSQMDIRPHILGEFDDTELTKLLGQSGHGVFCAPSIFSESIQRQYRVKEVGKTGDIHEDYYSITPSRQSKHQIVDHIHAMFDD
ncbi:Transcriptional activator protein NhaR [Zhongshania aliphaticivorans]|uniref:Transcriptional activator protein NhaR n=1 Tax=Zhongshania aliphaticivorans TaxID=1470434 RepID=A0A5S9Q7S0_9GAMM|nr:LysR family transcriptional regulator [Zhongshania aliphaticivorans]CAA0103708.1 Transcriptional activator protein NhaR [Zhongshania aliphaticivorans]CAA0113319.1 Transcriptional activator protein NhaR [Zhongshania aliphaticivorans]